MATPTDPLYSSQWHFGLIGNIELIWAEFTGAGVNVGVNDEGIDYRHEDLAANYDDSLHAVDDLGNILDPLATADEPHGTACAGIIAAANNDLGGVGVAWGATVTGVNIFSGGFGDVNGDTEDFVFIALQAIEKFDVTSNSWGAYPGFYSENGFYGSYGSAVISAYEAISADGRDGLGTIIVQAAGNDNENSNGDGLNPSRFTITVAATESTGFAASYSQFGASILVAAPAASVTSDLTGADGYDSGNYTTTFNGTSAATPVVSGVVALMLQANGGLGWRDVQNILAASATLTGSTFGTGPQTDEDGTWQANSAGTWNGGGYHVHANYGYGMVNAFNAVRMAETWHLWAPAQVSSNEQIVSSGLNDFADTILPEDNVSSFTTTFTIAEDICVEHVSLRLSFATNFVGDLQVVLTSAEGTEIVVQSASEISSAFDGSWVFGVDSLRGELSAGTWTLTLTDTFVGDSITVRDATLDVYGAASTPDDVYHFTDEYAAMVGFDGSRSVISDTNGGTDWLNMAAVTADVSLDLDTGEAFSFDGVVLGELSGTFENAVTGDGNDSIAGTTGDNRLHGMRGDDTLNGGGGVDVLVGGAGDDVYVTDGDDTITERAGQGDDTVRSSVSLTLGAHLENLVLLGSADIDGTGNAGANRLTGNSGANTLNGGGGADTLQGGAGDDVYITDGGDAIIETAGEGTDTVRSSVTFTLHANLENLILTGLTAIDGTGNSLANLMIGNSRANVLTAGAGADTLNGAGGTDVMVGGAGDDIYITDGDDTIIETAGEGTDTVRSTASFILGANLENLVLLGSADIDGTGNAGANRLNGNSGANILNGGGGADTLEGGAGDDIYITDGDDKIVENAGQGKDTVRSKVSLSLGANLENLVLLGSANLNGTGNNLANELTGNSGANRLRGGAGTDTLAGGAGHDRLAGGMGNDVLTGGLGADTLVGNSGKDRLSGGDGNDRLIGGAGRDKLAGGAGADTFVFLSVSDSGLSAASRDVITDFRRGVDQIDLAAIDANFGRIGNQEFSFIGRMAFGGTAGELRFAAGILSADIDGDGHADFQIAVVGLRAMGAGDFIL